MIGTSYNGTLPIGVATTGVEGLEAIVPISAISSWYDYYRANGMVRAPGGFQGEDPDVLAEYIYTRPDQADLPAGHRRPRRERRTASTGDYSAVLGRAQLHERHRQRPRGGARRAREQRLERDDEARGQFYEALKARGVPHQLYWHQGGHGGSPPLVRTNRWFTPLPLG